jgi:hypothetical protein
MMPTATCEVRPGLMQFVSTIGDAFENAVVESFWACMQTELLNRRRVEDTGQALHGDLRVDRGPP